MKIIRNINEETFVRNVRRWDSPEEDYSDIVTSIMDAEMEKTICEQIDIALDLEEDSDDDTVVDDMDEDDYFVGIDQG